MTIEIFPPIVPTRVLLLGPPGPERDAQVRALEAEGREVVVSETLEDFESDRDWYGVTYVERSDSVREPTTAERLAAAFPDVAARFATAALKLASSVALWVEEHKAEIVATLAPERGPKQRSRTTRRRARR